MLAISHVMKAAALAGAAALLIGGSAAQAQTRQMLKVQCDPYGERCAQVACKDDGSDCRPTGVKYYSPTYDGYYSGRVVCDERGKDCHDLPAGDR